MANLQDNKNANSFKKHNSSKTSNNNGKAQLYFKSNYFHTDFIKHLVE